MSKLHSDEVARLLKEAFWAERIEVAKAAERQRHPTGRAPGPSHGEPGNPWERVAREGTGGHRWRRKGEA